MEQAAGRQESNTAARPGSAVNVGERSARRRALRRRVALAFGLTGQASLSGCRRATLLDGPTDVLDFALPDRRESRQARRTLLPSETKQERLTATPLGPCATGCRAGVLGAPIISGCCLTSVARMRLSA